MRKILRYIMVVLALAIAALLYYFKTDSSNPYATTEWGKFSGTCAADEQPSNNFGKEFAECDYSVDKADIPTFKEIKFPFSNVFDNKKSLPLMAAAMIDLDNDGIDEVFIGGGVTQKDALFRYTSDGFTDISQSMSLPDKPEGTTTFGSSSVDLDGNGYTDLILTGDYGVHWYKNDGQKFTLVKIDAPLNDKSVAVTTTMGDFDRDGDLDIFLSAYIKLDKMEGQTIFKDINYGASSLMLENNGDDTFSDVTKEVGLEYVHNTFQATFVDLDNDGYLDLVVAHDTGEVRTYRNQNGNSFKMKPNPTTGKYAYPMGIALGDYNNDGNIDLFFSNTGTSVPTFLARGDLEEADEFISEWVLFRNNGNFSFTEVAERTKVADFEFSWGSLFEDFNLDGKQDLVVAENYVDFPPHKLFKLPGRFLIGREDGTFAAVEDQAGVVNKNYAIAPLSSDFNGDGYPDLMFSNLSGEVKAFINNGGKANYLAVRFPENAQYIGTRIELSLVDGSMLSDAYVIGEGLSSDQTSTVTFGLGAQSSVKKITFYYPSGETEAILKPGINQVHKIGF